MSSDRIGLDQVLVRREVDEAELAAVAFLARYSGRTLEAYRQDLRFFFAWTASVGLEVLAATRPHIELFRHHMEQRGLAASTTDRRLATVCGLYRFAHIDGGSGSNPAQYVRRPKVHPSQGHGMDRTELGRFLFTAERLGHHCAALAVLLGLNGLRVSEACETDIGDLGFDRGHRTVRILGKGHKPAVIPLVPRTARTVDLAIGERREGPILIRHDGQRLEARRVVHDRWRARGCLAHRRTHHHSFRHRRQGHHRLDRVGHHRRPTATRVGELDHARARCGVIARSTIG
jgi:site-specific recombinase XerD